MLLEGQTIKLDTHDGGLAELRFERGVEAVSKLDALAFGDLRRAIDAIAAAAAIKGVLITSAKDTFIVGADIFEFTSVFKRPEKDIEAFVAGKVCHEGSVSPKENAKKLQGQSLILSQNSARSKSPRRTVMYRSLCQR